MGAPVRAQVQVHGCGRLLMFASAAPRECRLNGARVDFEYEDRKSRLVVTLPREGSLDYRLSVVF